jgi:hypothetical protein
MVHPLSGIDKKLERSQAHIYNLEQQVSSFRKREPYTLRVREDIQDGERVGRVIAIKNGQIDDPDSALVLLAGEALYQLRSALDHLVHQLVIVAGNRPERLNQFPIFQTPDDYKRKAGKRIAGVSTSVAALIEGEQPYNRKPHAASQDELWILQDLNNTDKHRFVPITVLGIGGIRLFDKKGTLCHITSPDTVLEDNQLVWSFSRPDRQYDDIQAQITCAVAFEEAMEIDGCTMSLDHLLWRIFGRVNEIIEQFRGLF